MERKSITSEGKIISYLRAGDGKAVVLLHGFGVEASVWREQIDHLKAHYLVLAPDLPGVGASELTSDVQMEYIATLVKEIIENEGAEQAVVIGHSMGGYATLAFAEKYPERLTGFGLFHSTAAADSDEKKANRKKGIAFTLQHGAKAFLETTAPKMFAATTRTQDPDLYDHFMKHLPVMDKEAVVNYYEAMMARPDRTDVLKNAKVPVLFIYGREDEIISLEKTLEQASLPAISSIHILDHSGHLGMIEAPSAANNGIEDFLSDL